MLGLDSVSSALTSASQALAGNNPSSSAGSTTPVYVRGIHIDDQPSDVGGAVAHNLLNEQDLNLLLEFIHFGFVHTSYSNFFPHPSYKDNEKDDKILDGARPRGIQFRSALQRESIVLGVFMECTQTVLQDRATSAGALGSALNAVGSLLGAGGGGSGQTSPSDLNAPIQQVVAAIKPALAESITYPITHKAGMDLHQARANYRALLKTIGSESPSSNPAGGLLGQLPGLGSISGPIGDIISFAQGVANAPEDIKVKFFAKVALQQEPQIEIACNDMTLKAIQAGQNPVLPVWFGDPAKQGKWDSAPDSPLKPTSGSDPFSSVMNPVAGAVTGARNTAVNDANAVKSFFETPTATPPPGTDFLGEAFDLPKPPSPPPPPPLPGKPADPMPMQMSALSVQAFIEALGLTSPLNAFCQDVIADVFGLALDFIQGTYKALLTRSSDDAITDAALYAGAQSEFPIVKQLLALAADKIAFVQQAQQFSLNAPMGYTVGVGQLIDKEGNNLQDVINEKIGPLMDDALQKAMTGLAQQLELGRTDGNANKCPTMEWYLGRLPWVQSTLFFNLFFPFWNSLLQCLMSVVDPAAASVLKTITAATQTAQGALTSARNDMAKAQALQNSADSTMSQAGQGVNMLDPSSLSSLGKGYSKDMQATASKVTAPAPARGSFTVPVTGRVVTGQGQTLVKATDYDPVVPNNQWDNATSPQPDPNANKDQDPAAGAGAPAAGQSPAPAGGQN